MSNTVNTLYSMQCIESQKEITNYLQWVISFRNSIHLTPTHESNQPVPKPSWFNTVSYFFPELNTSHTDTRNQPSNSVLIQILNPGFDVRIRYHSLCSRLNRINSLSDFFPELNTSHTDTRNQPSNTVSIQTLNPGFDARIRYHSLCRRPNRINSTSYFFPSFHTHWVKPW